MRHSIVCFAVLPFFFLFSTLMIAQHGGGGGGVSSSGASGGGSHGGFSGGGSSVSSGGGHSSGAAHGSSTNGSAAHSSSHGAGPAVSRTGVKPKVAQLQKTDIITMFRHPFRKPELKPEPREVVEFRHRICPNGHCPVICAPGSAGARLGCASATHYACSHREVWNGGACLHQAYFLDDCERFRMEMARQQQIAAAAETDRQTACASGVSQSCYSASAEAQNQAAIYQTYLDRYRQCRNRTLDTLPFGAYSSLGFSNAFMMEALSASLK